MYIGNQPYQSAFLTDLFNGNGGTTFTMSVAPANTASVLVAVSGVLQSPDTYSVVGTTLTFSSAPPVGTGNISARYLGIPASNVTTTAYRTVTEFTATASQTTFTPPSYTVGFINVYRNGVRLGSADYTATNGTTVVLASGAASGDLVAIESFLVSSVLNAIPNTAGSVGASNLAGGSVTQAALAGNNVAGNGPAFSAYLSGTQSISASTATKIAFNVKTFDTNNCYDNTTNYRFTPTVAGYYQISASMDNSATISQTRAFLSVYKNGSAYARLQDSNGSIIYQQSGSVLVYCNGTTDYIEIYGQINGTSPSFSGGAIYATWFTGVLVRSA
jgi:hypothetical protein